MKCAPYFSLLPINISAQFVGDIKTKPKLGGTVKYYCENLQNSTIYHMNGWLSFIVVPLGAWSFSIRT